MLIRRWLLVGFVGLTLLYATGVLFDNPILPAAEPLAWAALLGYLLLSAGADPRGRTRAALLAGIAALGVAALITVVRPPEPDFDWQALTSGQLLSLSGPDLWGRLLALTGFGCLAYAVVGQPGRRGWPVWLGAVLGAGAALVWLGPPLVDRPPPTWSGEAEVAGSIAVVVPALVVLGLAVAAFAIAGAAVARRPRSWASAGLLLVAVSVAVLDAGVVRPLVLLRPPENRAAPLLVTVSGPATGPVALEVAGTVGVLATMFGAAIVVVALCRARPVDTKRAAPPDPGS